MPVYTFECEKCKKKMDKIQKFDESNPVLIPAKALSPIIYNIIR